MDQETVRHLFDYQDGQLIWKNPCARSKAKAGQRAGTLTPKGYRQVGVDWRLHMEHRLVFLWHHGYSPTQIDHINQDRSDNRIENLRAATPAQNSANTALRANNTSGMRGVRWDSLRKKWKVDVHANGRSVFSARFDDVELAELVSIEARNKYHGGFARHG